MKYIQETYCVFVIHRNDNFLRWSFVKNAARSASQPTIGNVASILISAHELQRSTCRLRRTLSLKLNEISEELIQNFFPPNTELFHFPNHYLLKHKHEKMRMPNTIFIV